MRHPHLLLPRSCPRNRGMIAMSDRRISLSLVSVGTLRELSNQMGPDVCRQFVGNYMEMWDGRYSKLVSTLHMQDYPAALDVVLSIKISSHMAGADRLAKLAQHAEQLVHKQDQGGLVSMLESFRKCGEDTLHQLEQALPNV